MTALLVISASKSQPHFVKRRHAYGEHLIGNRYCYVREEHNSPTYMRRDKGRIQLLQQCLDDIRSLHLDPTATIFAAEQEHEESVEAFLKRGHQLPLSTSTGHWCELNTAQYRAVDFR